MSTVPTMSGRTMRRILVTALCAGAPATLFVASASASASAATTANSFKLSGAGKGTVTEGATGSCLAGKEGGGIIEIDDLVGSVSGYTNVASWTVVINESKNGTFKFKANSSRDPRLALNPSLKNHNLSAGDKEDLDGTSGTVKVQGSSGSVNATVRKLTSTGYGKSMKISGSWTCPTT